MAVSRGPGFRVCRSVIERRGEEGASRTRLCPVLVNALGRVGFLSVVHACSSGQVRVQCPGRGRVRFTVKRLGQVGSSAGRVRA